MGPGSSASLCRKSHSRRDHSIAKKKVSGSIVISRELAANSEFLTYLSPQFTVKGKSFISIEPVLNSGILPSSDWIFFSSKNAVHQFFKQGYEVGSRKVAAIGDATANSLKSYVEVDFIGEGSTTQVAQQFSEIANGEQVLFPVSAKSVQTIQQALEASQVNNFVIYDTVEQVPEMVELPDVLVFTSPSNVRSFMKSEMANELNATIVAIGNTTEKELLNFGIPKIYTPWKSSELALADIIKPILFKKD